MYKDLYKAATVKPNAIFQKFFQTEFLCVALAVLELNDLPAPASLPSNPMLFMLI